MAGRIAYLFLSIGVLTASLWAQPSIVLVTIDTLRADRVTPELMPSLEAFGKEAVRFNRAFAQVPITLPSHVTIMTGTYPMSHGIRDFGGFTLSPEALTLAEVLKQEGYETAAFVSSFALDSQWGLDQGFDVYRDDFDMSTYRGIGFNAVHRPANETIDAVLPWLSMRTSTRPFFLWVHLFDPHDPYDPPEPYLSRFPGRPYDGEVAFVDAQLARLFEVLRERGLFDSSLVVVMADHGEGLGEHGEETHGFFVYNTTIQIPLFFKFPGGEYAGKVMEDVVQSVDVAPTILQALRIRKYQDMQGRGLLGLIRSGRAASRPVAYAESYYAKYHFGWSSLRTYQDDRYKFIRVPRAELYDTQNDPDERDNLFEDQAAVGNQYDNLLSSFAARFASSEDLKSGAEQEMDEETRQRLQSLGYVTMAPSRVHEEDDSGLPDPKDKIGIFTDIRNATIESEKGNYKASSERLTRVLGQDPDIYTARYLQGFNFFQMNQLGLAIDQFKAAIELSPESANAVHSLAVTYARLGMDDFARPGFEHLLRLRPGNAGGHLGLGDLSLKAKDIETARMHYLKVLESVEHPDAYLGLGRTYGAENRWEEAIEQFKKALALRPNSRETLTLLAYCYRQIGDEETAQSYMGKANALPR